MKNKKKIYIASPYTKGDPAVNVKRQLDCFNELVEAGFAPFAPLLFHFQHLVHPQPYNVWIEHGLIWVGACDAVLRLEGDSPGADGETEYGDKLGLPIFYDIKHLVSYYNN